MSVFARIGTIKGESLDARHPDEIDVLTWSWGVSRADGGAIGSGAAVGKATVHDLVLTHRVDRASPLLMKACVKGTHIPDARITVRRTGTAQQDHLVITLTDVLVSSVSTTVTDEGATTDEAVVLSFGKVDLEYKPQKADGSLGTAVRFSHDRKTGKTG